MNKTSPVIQEFYRKACLFEASLSLIAVLLSWAGDVEPFESLQLTEPAFYYGLIGTLPLVALFLVFERVPIAEFQRIKNLLLETLGPIFQNRHWSDLFVLAAIAGWSEELLFRGVLQPWFERAWGEGWGVLGCNVVFGLAHAITPLYFVLATLIGFYLSWSMDFGVSRNLMTPIFIHSFYDFWAFVALTKAYKDKQYTP